MSCPSAMGVRSTSIGAPAAIVAASGFIWETKGQSAASPPTAAAAPVATKRKSRRVGWSAEDAVVTIPNPFLAAAGGTAQETPKADAQVRDQGGAAGARDPRGGRRPASSAQAANQAVQNRSIGTLAERAQAHYPPANVQCTKTLQTVVLFIHSGDTTRMELALFQPYIPQTTAPLLRLCPCLDVRAHIIEPAGFPVSDRAFRRAGMDYLDQVRWMRHDSWSLFEQWRRGEGFRLLLFTTKAAVSYLDFRYAASDILLFGRETVGVTDEVGAAAGARLKIPMKPHLRSLNVAMAAAMVVGEALRQTGQEEN